MQGYVKSVAAENTKTATLEIPKSH